MAIPSDRKCLVVLGMHRSGTSAIAGVLELAGLDLGENFLPPTEDNPKGFFENARITMLNDQILGELFSSWDDTLLIPDNWWKYEKFKEYAEKIIAVYREEFNGTGPILFKDPRLSILLPLYLDVFSRLGIKPAFLTCTRNPFEVAASLQKRNHLAQEKTLLLWMDYQLKAELYSRNMPRIFVSYLEFLANPVNSLNTISKALDIDIGVDPATEKAILSFIDPQLKHHNLPPDLPGSGQVPGLKELFALLDHAHLQDLSHERLGTIDLIRAQFYSQVKIFNGLPDQFEAAVTIHYGNGTKTRQRMPVRYGNMELTFPVDPAIPVNRIDFLPSNSSVGLKMIKPEFHGPGESLSYGYDLKTNASYKNEDGLMTFETGIPKIIINFPVPATLVQFTFTMTYLAFGHYSGRMAWILSGGRQEKLRSELQTLKKQVKAKQEEILRVNQAFKVKNAEFLKSKHELNELNKSRRQLESQIEKIRSSLSYRVGRIITAPARFFYKR